MDLAGDHRFFDATETVNLIRKTATSGDDAADSVAQALRQDVRTADASGAMIVTGNELMWHLPDANITASPRPGDVIKDSANVRWVVQTANFQLLIESWECFSTKER